MKEIYIVIEESGSYDSYRSSTILATPSVDKANEKVKEMEARLARAMKCYDELTDIMREWVTNNPPPKWPQEALSTQSRIVISADEKFRLKYAEWARLRFDKDAEVRSAYTKEEQEDMHSLFDCRWSVDTVPYAE